MGVGLFIWRIIMSGYSSTLDDGREIYIPYWSASTQFKHLTEACKYLGQDNVIAISALNVPAAMLAVMGSDDAEESTRLVLHYCQQVRVDGDRVNQASFDEIGITVLIEMFTHVLHAHYDDFFVSGLAKAASLKE